MGTHWQDKNKCHGYFNLLFSHALHVHCFIDCQCHNSVKFGNKQKQKEYKEEM